MGADPQTPNPKLVGLLNNFMQEVAREVTPPLPPDKAPPSTERMCELMERMIALQEQTVGILTKKHSEWVDGHTAAEMLGKSRNKAGSYKVLNYCIGKGWLKTFGQLRPRTYLRSEVQDIVDRVKTGLVLP